MILDMTILNERLHVTIVSVHADNGPKLYIYHKQSILPSDLQITAHIIYLRKHVSILYNIMYNIISLFCSDKLIDSEDASFLSGVTSEYLGKVFKLLQTADGKVLIML